MDDFPASDDMDIHREACRLAAEATLHNPHWTSAEARAYFETYEMDSMLGGWS